MDAGQDILRRLRIDDRALFHDATESRLDMSAGATEAVIQVDVAEGRIEIVLEEAVHDAAADPYAFRIAGGTGHLLGHFGKIVQPLGVFLGLLRSLLLGLVGLFVLGHGRRKADKQGKAKGGQGVRMAERHDDE